MSGGYGKCEAESSIWVSGANRIFACYMDPNEGEVRQDTKCRSVPPVDFLLCVFVVSLFQISSVTNTSAPSISIIFTATLVLDPGISISYSPLTKSSFLFGTSE